jgi:hypothetical protein
MKPPNSNCRSAAMRRPCYSIADYDRTLGAGKFHIPPLSVIAVALSIWPARW